MTTKGYAVELVNGLSAALVERIEEAEGLVIRSFPKTAKAKAAHVSKLKQATADAASLAEAIEVLVRRSTGDEPT